MENNTNINTTNLEILRNYLNKVIIASQCYNGIGQLKLDDLLSDWYEAKKPYIDLFGGNPILCTGEKISITLSEENKARRFSDMEDAFDDLLEEYPDIPRAEDGMTFWTFLAENKEGFFDNRVVRNYPELNIKRGTKLLRCFKYFFPTRRILRAAQDLASRFIQENKIEGYLYLSVHPLDFLTMSENNSNWRSCHSLQGEYRAGNLSYMVDHSTIVAYLANGTTENLPLLPENVYMMSKQWRMLVHTDEFKHVIYYNRQYPFDSDDLRDSVYEKLNTLAGGSFRSPQKTGFAQIKTQSGEIMRMGHNFIAYGDFIYDTHDAIDESDFLGYCDLIYSPHYSPIVSTLYSHLSDENEDDEENEMARRSYVDVMFHRTHDIKIGEPVKCVICGNNFIRNTNSFLCDRCNHYESYLDDWFSNK